jgi:pimeloyl-ACP methyl ester carboxylesterase
MDRVAGLHYQLVAARDRVGGLPPLLVLPGLLGDERHLKRLWPALAARRAVVCVDPLGGGRSDVPADPGAYAWDAQVERLMAVLDAIDCERVDLLGLSLGGVWAQHALARRPERFRLAVLCATTGPLGPRERSILLGLRALVESSIDPLALARCLIAWIFSPPFLDRPGAATVMEALVGDLPAPGSPGLIGQVGALLGHASFDGLAAIHHVRKVLVGEWDYLMPPAVNERLARALPGAELEIVDGGGHALWVERPDAVVAAVRSALESEPR